MIMTEQEAKLKWCPFARVAYERNRHNGYAMTSYNRFESGAPSSSAHCVTKDCMAWQQVSADPNTGCCGAFSSRR